MDKKTLATERPELFDQLHPTRNIGLDPNKLTPQSNKKYGGNVLKDLTMNGKPK